MLSTILFPSVYAQQEPQPAWIELGFGCCTFFDLNLGVPAYVAGEELWVKANVMSQVQLYSANGSRIATQDFREQSAGLLHTFRVNDPGGRWLLDVSSPQGSVRYPLYVVPSRVSIAAPALAYGLNGSNFTIGGAVNFGIEHEGGVVLLSRLNQTNLLETNPAPFIMGEFRARISWERSDPLTLTVAPYALALTTPNATRVWAEVWSEIPLLKQVGNNLLATFEQALVADSHWIPLNLTSRPSPVIELKLPLLHNTAPGGQIPLREGLHTIKIFAEINSVMYVTQTETYFLEDGYLSSVASTASVPPLLTSFTFGLSDSLLNLSEYRITALMRHNGVNVVWQGNVTPPIAHIRLINRLDAQPIEDYEITSSAFQAVAKVGTETYVIPTDFDGQAPLTVSIGGVPVAPDETAPNPVRLRPIEPVVIFAEATRAQLQVSDMLGTAITQGTVRVSRVVGNEQLVAFQREWASPNGLLNFTLPTGDYVIEITVEGNTITRRLAASEPSASISMQLGELILTETRDSLLFLAIAAVIVLAEILASLRVWRRVARGSDGSGEAE
jgi:hypothetical protein